MNWSAAPLLHPATGQEMAPPCLDYQGILSSALSCLLLSGNHQLHIPHTSCQPSLILMCDAVFLKTSQVHKHCFTAFWGQKTFLSFPHVFKCSVRDLPEDSFLPQPALGHTFSVHQCGFSCAFCMPQWNKTSLAQRLQFFCPLFITGTSKGTSS